MTGYFGCPCIAFIFQSTFPPIKTQHLCFVIFFFFFTEKTRFKHSLGTFLIKILFCENVGKQSKISEAL